uniref:Putative secreted protein n=1 Tax=Ixodes ricinus TaxID=34613 RepID=A0A6B0U5J8_IXORI
MENIVQLFGAGTLLLTLSSVHSTYFKFPRMRLCVFSECMMSLVSSPAGPTNRHTTRMGHASTVREKRLCAEHLEVSSS